MSTDTSTIAENKALIRKFLQAMESADGDRAANLMSEAGTWELVEQNAKQLNPTELAEAINGFSSMFSKPLTLTLTSMTADEDRVSVEASAYGELADDRVYDVRVNFLFEIRDGKIAAGREYVDTAYVAKTFDANARLVNTFFDALSNRDVDEVLATLDNDASYWVAGRFPLAGTYTKSQFEANLRGQNPDFRSPPFTRPMQLTISGITSQGDRVAVEAKATGELDDGSEFVNDYHYLFIVRDGRIVELRQYMDTQATNDVFCREELRVSA